MNTQMLPGHNVHALTHPPGSRVPATPHTGTPAEIIRPVAWGPNERIRNISLAIRERYDDAVFLNTAELSDLLDVSTRTIKRIPAAKLPRFSFGGVGGNRYAVCDIAHYIVMHSARDLNLRSVPCD